MRAFVNGGGCRTEYIVLVGGVDINMFNANIKVWFLKLIFLFLNNQKLKNWRFSTPNTNLAESIWTPCELDNLFLAWLVSEKKIFK